MARPIRPVSGLVQPRTPIFSPSMRRARPLFDPDPGWLFLLAGLAMICAAVILPVHRQLHELRQQVMELEAEEQTSLARLKAHAAFRDLLAQDDPTLMARLAASQLNMIRRGERAVLIATTSDAPLTDWVDATVRPVTFDAEPYPESRLVRLVTGDKRQWVLAASAFCIFAGLVLGPARESRRRRSGATEADHATGQREFAVEAAATTVAIAMPEDVEELIDEDEYEYEDDADDDDADAEWLDEEPDATGDEQDEEASTDAVMLAGREEDDDEVDSFAEEDDEEEQDEEDWSDEDFEDDDETEFEDDEYEDEEDEDEDEDEDEELTDDDESDEEEDEEYDDDEGVQEDEDEDEEWEDDGSYDEEDEEWEDEEVEDDEEDEDDEDDDPNLTWSSPVASPVNAPRTISVSAPVEDAERVDESKYAGDGLPEVEVVRRVPSVPAPRDEEPGEAFRTSLF